MHKTNAVPHRSGESAVIAPYGCHSSAVRYPTGTPWKRSKVSMRTMWLFMTLVRRSHGVLCDVTASTARIRLVVYFKALLVTSYNDRTKICALLGVLLFFFLFLFGVLNKLNAVGAPRKCSGSA